MICDQNEKNSFLAIVDMHAPIKTMGVRARSSPWITSELKKQMHERNILKLKAIKSNDPNDDDDPNIKRSIRSITGSYYLN